MGHTLHSLATLASVGFVVATASAQVSVQVIVAQPVQLQASITGGTPSLVTVPIGTDITNGPPILAQSLAASGGGSTSLTVTAGASAFGTTCELVQTGFYATYSGQTFTSQQTGEEFVTFRSLAPVGGVLVAQAHSMQIPGSANANVAADFGADGSFELASSLLTTTHHSEPCVLAPGQDFVVRIAHQGSLGSFPGSPVGNYSRRITLRFVPHADGYDVYGPTTGCLQPVVVHSLDGTARLTSAQTTPVDCHVLVAGQSQVAVALPLSLTSTCPLLSSADLVLVGPLLTPSLEIAAGSIPVGASAYLQFVGLHFATWTAVASRGIRGFGQ